MDIWVNRSWDICAADNFIRDEGAIAIAQALNVPEASLRTLNLLRSGIEEDGAKAIIAVYEQSPTLQSLCGLTSGVTKLDLSNQCLSHADALLLAAELNKGATTGSLRTLNLLRNEIGKDGLEAIIAPHQLSQGRARSA